MDLNQETVLRPAPNGLLESGRSDRVISEIKPKILDNYRLTGNMCEAAQACGVPYVTVRWHIANDPGFAAQVDLVHREFVERAKGYMLTHMARPGNYMDRVTIARRYEPGYWGDTSRVQVDVNVTHVREAIQEAQTYEAELSDSNLEVKAKEVEGTAERHNDTALINTPQGGVIEAEVPSP